MGDAGFFELFIYPAVDASIEASRTRLKYKHSFLDHLKERLNQSILDLSAYDHALEHSEHSELDHLVICLEEEKPSVTPDLWTRDYRIPITEYDSLPDPDKAAEVTYRHLLSLQTQGDHSLAQTSRYLCFHFIDRLE